MISITKLNNEPIKIVLEKNSFNDNIVVKVEYNDPIDNFQISINKNYITYDDLNKIFLNYSKPHHFNMSTDNC